MDSRDKCACSEEALRCEEEETPNGMRLSGAEGKNDRGNDEIE
jgi:hypothetical protein